MTENQNHQAILESRLNQLEEENKLLLTQLRQIHEELEQYYLRNKELENNKATSSPSSVLTASDWVDDDLPKALAEILRLQALVESQQKIYRLEMENSLKAKLGSLLIQSAHSPASLIALPLKLLKIWRVFSRHISPEALGGEDFKKIIAAYDAGGFMAVENLINKVSVPPVIEANALTALARYLMSSDYVSAAEAAHRAYAVDPKPYRLKWLAFRLHEAGDLIQAESLLEILPLDTSFSDSENRQLNQLRHEAKQDRDREAKQKSGFSERRFEVENYINELIYERDSKSQLLDERNREIEALKQVQVNLETEKAGLVERQQQQSQLLDERNREIEALKQVQVNLETEKAGLVERQQQQSQLLDERNREIEALKQVQVNLETEKAGLVERQQQQSQLLDERNREIEALKQVQVNLETEKAGLVERQQQQSQLLDERNREIEALKQVQVNLETEKAGLVERQQQQSQLLDERNREIEALKQVQVNLETEKAGLVERQQQQSQLLDERNREIEALKQVQVNLETEKAGLVERQQLMQEEMIRAEAQVDIIKGLLMRDSEL